MSQNWIVQRIEANGSTTRTVPMSSELEANALYDNWCQNIKRFNDQSISLISAVTKEMLIANRTNTEFRPITPPKADKED